MRHLSLFLLTLACFAMAGVAFADPGDKPAVPRKDKAKQQLTVTPEREAAVMTFIARNHPELAELLSHLKSSQPREYEKAIKELHRVTERLAMVRERDMAQYELEVAAWTAQSKVQLLAARLKMGDSETVRKELRAALSSQMDARLAVLKHQREQATQRLGKMDSEISKLQGDREALIEKQLQTLEQSLGDKSSAKSSGAKQVIKKATSGSATKPAE